MSYNWSSINGSPTKGLIGSTIADDTDTPYFCGSSATDNAYATKLIGTTITTLFENSNTSAFTSMQILDAYFLAGFNYIQGVAYLVMQNLNNTPNTSWTAPLPTVVSPSSTTGLTTFSAMKIYDTTLIAVGSMYDRNTSTDTNYKAYIVKTDLNLTTPIVYYNSNLVATYLTGVSILVDNTIISVGQNSSENAVIFANDGKNPYVSLTGIFYAVTLDSNDNIYACGITTKESKLYGFVQKFTYSNGFTLVKEYQDSVESFYTSITTIKDEIYISGGYGNNKINCNPYIRKFDSNLNSIIKYTGTQNIKLIEDVKSNSISVDSVGTIYSIYMSASDSSLRDPILIIGVSNGFIIYRQVTANLSGGGQQYTLDNLNTYISGTFNAIVNNSQYIYAAGSGTAAYIYYPIIYRQPIDNLSGGGQTYNIGLPSTIELNDIAINSNYIYAVGTSLFTGFIYRQPINNLTGGGESYTIDGISSYTNVNIIKLKINSDYIYAVAKSLEGSFIYRQPINNLTGGGQIYTITESNLVFENLVIDSQYIYLCGSYTTSQPGLIYPLIYKQPINNLSGGGQKYILDGLEEYENLSFSDLNINSGYIYACGTGIIDFYPCGVVYRQAIDGGSDEKYTNRFLQQDSILSITNFGNDIVKSSIDLLVTYIES